MTEPTATETPVDMFSLCRASPTRFCLECDAPIGDPDRMGRCGPCDAAWLARIAAWHRGAPDAELDALHNVSPHT